MMRNSNLFWGAMLILAGGAFLLQTMGLLQGVNLWGLLWPVFLILLGAWILLGRFSRGQITREKATVSLDGASQARLKLEHGAGRLDVRGGAASLDLVEGTFGGGVQVSSRRDGATLDAKLSLPSQSLPFLWGPGYSLDWEVRLNQSVPIALELGTGAAEANLDLADLKITELRLQTGASSSNITLPANAGFTRVRIESGAASVVLRIPEGVAAHIRASAALGAVNVNTQRFPRVGGEYQSPDYDTAANKVDIHVETGVGSVEIQ